MKSKANSKILVLITLGVFSCSSAFFIPQTNFRYSYSTNLRSEDPKISTVSGKIHIDNDWSAVIAAGICTGNGTYSDPYLIEGLEIDGGGLGSCILIENTDVFFKVESCIVYNSGNSWSDAGITLYNVKNSQLINNNCSYNTVGIFLNMFCANNTILGNIVSKNIESGITMVNQCENNTVLGNTISNCGSLTMEIYASNNNKILENDVNNNVNGIWVMECNNITISDNTLNNIGYNGIYSQFCQNITISRNIIKNVNYRGINLENTGGSIIFINCFTNNIVNAFDVNINNQWDNGIKGNYWDDYTGIDENGDGIGDSPYVFGNIQDNFPLMECPLSSKEPNVIPLDLIISILSIGVGAAIILALLISNYRKKRRRTSGQK